MKSPRLVPFAATTLPAATPPTGSPGPTATAAGLWELEPDLAAGTLRQVRDGKVLETYPRLACP